MVLFFFLLAEYSKDLPTYLQYCKDVVFAGMELPFEDHEEEKIIEQLWEFYQDEKVIFLADNECGAFLFLYIYIEIKLLASSCFLKHCYVKYMNF